METPPTKQRLMLSTGKVDGRTSGGDAFSTDFCNLVLPLVLVSADDLRCKSKILTSSFRRSLEPFVELDIVVDSERVG